MTFPYPYPFIDMQIILIDLINMQITLIDPIM